jgi:hypothetical protein
MIARSLSLASPPTLVCWRQVAGPAWSSFGMCPAVSRKLCSKVRHGCS